MRFILGLIFGALIGAGFALMYAPTSGKEMRENIKSQVDENSAKLQEQWQKGYQQMQNKVEKLSGDLQSMTKQAKEDVETQVEKVA